MRLKMVASVLRAAASSAARWPNAGLEGARGGGGGVAAATAAASAAPPPEDDSRAVAEAAEGRGGTAAVMTVAVSLEPGCSNAAGTAAPAQGVWRRSRVKEPERVGAAQVSWIRYGGENSPPRGGVRKLGRQVAERKDGGAGRGGPQRVLWKGLKDAYLPPLPSAHSPLPSPQSPAAEATCAFVLRGAKGPPTLYC